MSARRQRPKRRSNISTKKAKDYRRYSDSPTSHEASITERGISVIRSLHPEDLKQIMDRFEELTQDITSIPRSRGDQYDPALNQLQMREIKWNESVLGSISARHAVDSLYWGVDSLRTTKKVEIGRIALFANEQTPARPVGIAFSSESTEEILQERYDIRRTIIDLTDSSPEDFRWKLIMQPHITIGRILKTTPESKITEILSGLEEVCPPTLMLKKAKINNPNK